MCLGGIAMATTIYRKIYQLHSSPRPEVGVWYNIECISLTLSRQTKGYDINPGGCRFAFATYNNRSTHQNIYISQSARNAANDCTIHVMFILPGQLSVATYIARVELT